MDVVRGDYDRSKRRLPPPETRLPARYHLHRETEENTFSVKEQQQTESTERKKANNKMKIIEPARRANRCDRIQLLYCHGILHRFFLAKFAVFRRFCRNANERMEGWTDGHTLF